MSLCTQSKTSFLFVVAALLLAIWNTAQLLIDRAGRTTDFTDFALGIVFGVAIGLMLLVAIRTGRGRRGAAS